MTSEYLSMLNAHFSYWTNLDVNLFMMRAMYGMDAVTGNVLDRLQLRS